MTLAAEYVRAIYVGTGTTGPFAVPFSFTANAHVKVAKRAASGTVTTLAEGTDYTLAGGPAAGQVTLVVALLSTESIEVYRERPLSQSTALGLNSSYRSAVQEAAFDEARQVDQDLAAKISRALSAPPTEEMSLVLPPKASRAGALLGFNSAGEPIAIDPDTLDAMGDGDQLGVLPISGGGTGGITAAEARTNLGIGAVGTLASIAAGDIATAHAATSHASIISADLIANSATRLRDIGIWVVESATVTTAPAVTNGLAYLVPIDATGTWTAQAGKVAYGEASAWVYKTPAKGWIAIARDTDIEWYHDGTAWGIVAGTGTGSGGDALLASLDARIVGFGKSNMHGGARFRVHWTADQRIVAYGDQGAFGFDPAGDSWGPFEIPVPWDTSTITIENIYVGLNYILVQTDQSTGNLWHMGSSAHGQGGMGGTTSATVLTRITKFVTDAVKISAVYTEANVGNADAFWFAVTMTGTAYGCGSSGATHTMGYASTTNLTTPRKLTYSDGTTPVTGVVSISCCTVYAPVWALLSTGAAVRWGAGTTGAHGNNNTTAMQWPDALETTPSSGIDRTDIAQVVVTGSFITSIYAVTWIRTTAGKIEASGNRVFGLGDGAALAGSVNTFQPASGAIAALTTSLLVAGGGEYAMCLAITSTGTGYMCGYQASFAQLGGGATTNLNVFTALVGLPSGFAGALTGGRIAGGGGFNAVYLEATISGIKYLASIGYDGFYQTGKNTTGVAAAAQTWGLVLGGKGTISAWQTVGDSQVYGLEILNTDGELRYAGGNDQGQGGVQFGNLHSVAVLQPCRGSGPRLAKPITWLGAYSAGTAYTARDVVEYGGSSWVNILESTGVAPPTLPTESNSNWQLSAKHGYDSIDANLGQWNFDSVTTSGPASGAIRFNNATLASVTAIYLSETDLNGAALAALIATFDDSTSSTKGTIVARKQATPGVFLIGNVTALTDNGSDVSLTVTHLSSAGTFTAGDDINILYSAKGDIGAGYGGTISATLSLAIGTKTFTTGTDKAWVVGDRVRLSAATGWMEGLVSAYNSSTGLMSVVVVNSTDVSGSGSPTSWTIGIAGQPGAGLATPAGSTYQMQYNGGGALAATAGLAWDPATSMQQQTVVNGGFGTELMGYATGTGNNVKWRQIVNRSNFTDGSGVGGVNYSNEVVAMGWNLSGTVGNSPTPGTPAIWDNWEYKFATGGKYHSERHMESVDTSGVRHRFFSYLIPHDGGSGSSFGQWVDTIGWSDFAAAESRVQWNILSRNADFGNATNGFQLRFGKNNIAPLVQNNAAGNAYLLLPYFNASNQLALNGQILHNAASPGGGGVGVAFNFTGASGAGSSLLAISQSSAATGTQYSCLIDHNTDQANATFRNLKSNSTAVQQVMSAGSAGIQYTLWAKTDGTGWAAGRNASGNFEIGPYQIPYSASLTIDWTNQNVAFAKPPKLPSYTVATVPSASTYGAGSVLFVTNEIGGATPAFSDGTNWRRYADRAIIS